MAANENVLSPPISQKPLSDAGAIGVVTAGKEVGDSYHCEERSAEVAEYEESANAAPSSARMPKRRSKQDGQNLGQENQPEAETEPSGVVIVVVSTSTVAP